MREIRTSGSMSGERKRSDATWPKPLRLSSTLLLLFSTEQISILRLLTERIDVTPDGIDVTPDGIDMRLQAGGVHRLVSELISERGDELVAEAKAPTEEAAAGKTSTRPGVDTVTVRIPMRFERRGGRKLIIAPDGSAPAAANPDRDETMIRALVKAHCWRRRIESGNARSITDLAGQEGVTDAYVCRLLPLTCLAPGHSRSHPRWAAAEWAHARGTGAEPVAKLE